MKLSYSCYARKYVVFLWLTCTLLLTSCGSSSNNASPSKNGEGNTNKDTKAPTISKISPANKSTKVALNSKTTITFSEAMLSPSITANAVSLENEQGEKVVGKISFDGDKKATFTPTSSLALLSKYITTVSKGVADLAGNTMATAKTYSFTTRDGKWQKAQRLEINNAGNANKPQIAFDAKGNAIAVWRQYDGTRTNIWANRFNPSTGWAGAELIESDNNRGAYYPQIAFDAKGNAIAVWYQSDGTRFNIWANRFNPSTGWAGAELIESDNNGGAYYPQIAFDAKGNAIAVWRQHDGTRFNIWANRFTSNTGWAGAELIETDNNGDAGYPQIAFDAKGNAIAVWEQFDGTRTNIWANRFSPSTGWAGAELIETDNNGHAYYPQIAFDAKGNAIAVWRQYDGTRFNIWANRFTPNTGWAGAELIETDNNGDADRPQVAFDAKGNAIAVWYQYDGTRFNIWNIWANRFSPSTGWAGAELIESDNNGHAYDPQIAFDAKGNAIAVWNQFDGTRTNIWANRFSPSTGWVGAELIETDNNGSAFDPQIAFDAKGNAIAVWKQSDGTRSNIWANRFQ